jgi:hypothetical protein
MRRSWTFIKVIACAGMTSMEGEMFVIVIW